MSLTSYRAAPPRVTENWLALEPTKRAACAAQYPLQGHNKEKTFKHALCRPGSDLLSRVLRRSTISAGMFHGRVRNGNGCSHPAITTRSAKSMLFEKLSIAPPIQFEWAQEMRTIKPIE